ncbi:MAG: RNA polymerase factor sigma-54 [bacterium]|nr:RNA polymerase factor sigma-54 [bacterium]MCP5070730.1 RNA polymerase factor sigma-54 [bacterium]
MGIELKLQLKMSQQLVMTPQLQQAIKLLQLSRLELEQTVQQELQENPVLEVLEIDEELPKDVGREEEAPDNAPAEASGDASDSREASDAEKISDIDWQNYIDAYPQTGMGTGVIRDDDERPGFEATLTKRESLQDHLEWQIGLSTFTDAEKAAAGWILGNLDEKGYLRSSIEEIARQSGIDEKEVEQALERVQRLDPPGVAARDLRECLLNQLGPLCIKDPIVRTLIDQYLDALQKRDFRRIARELMISVEEAAAAARVVAQLEPRPGRAYGGDEPIYITPDIYVYKVADEFHIVLNEDGLPKLKINNLYRDVLAKDRSVEQETRTYVQEKVRAAMWLIKSIHQRQRTIYRVMESIIRHQREFFERGVAYLKPLNLRDVADDIGMHESTVSRVTTNKYCHTPQGIFELKYFFNSSINRVQGEAIASESVKAKIKKIIRNEDGRRPLSDQRIAEMLKTANIDIARRTVTKYRESMNILSSTRRRQVG